MESLEFHPLANVFPLLQGEALASLVTDIRARGLNHPITLYEGKILDGRNRYRACMEAGVAVRTDNWQGSEAEAAAFVWSENAERRDLAPGQRAFARLELDSLVREIQARARQAQKEHGNTAPGRTADTFLHVEKSVAPIHTEEQLAKLAGVGSGTMARAGVLKRKADSGDRRAAKLIEQVKAGTKKLTTAYNDARNVTPAAPTPRSMIDEQPDATIISLPVGRQNTHPAEMLVAALGALRRTVEKQDPITDGVLAAWWDGIEWREWEAARGDVLWFLKQCMPLLGYVSKHRNHTPPMVRTLKDKAIDAPPEPKARRA